MGTLATRTRSRAELSIAAAVIEGRGLDLYSGGAIKSKGQEALVRRYTRRPYTDSIRTRLQV
jgi:hypothetical protein